MLRRRSPRRAAGHRFLPLAGWLVLVSAGGAAGAPPSPLDAALSLPPLVAQGRPAGGTPVGVGATTVNLGAKPPGPAPATMHAAPPPTPGDPLAEATKATLRQQGAMSIGAQKIQHLLPYALLSRAAYHGEPPVGGWALDHEEKKWRGFRAGVYKKGSQVVVAFAGTDDLADGLVDVKQFLGKKLPRQYQQAEALAAQLLARHGRSSIVLTGHSLGGGLATYAAARLGLAAYTFNAAGLVAGWESILKDPDLCAASLAQITHLMTQGWGSGENVLTINEQGWVTEVVSLLGHHPGKVLVVPVDVPGQLEAWALIKYLHGIDTVIAALQGQRAPASGATVVVMDLSSSMAKGWRGGVKIESARAAAKRLLARIANESQVTGAGQQYALVTFGDGASVEVALTGDVGQVAQALDAAVPRGQTNIGAALAAAKQALAGAPSGAARTIVLLTDGEITAGPSPADTLAGPAQEAAQSGTCLHVIGFGDAGGLDEGFLGALGGATSCGGYYFADDADKLAFTYAKVKHVAGGSLLSEASGVIAPGETVDLGAFDVPVGKGELCVSLDWEGSTVRLHLTDPRGRAVDANYPGARFFLDRASVYAVVSSPAAGSWKLGAFGEDLPEGPEDFYAAASIRGTTGPAPKGPAAFLGGGAAPPPRRGPSPWAALAATLAAAGAAGVGATLMVNRRRRGSRPLALRVTAGPAVGASLALGAAPAVLGREAADLVLAGPDVSRRHAEVAMAGTVLRVRDLGSTNGTRVNGKHLPPGEWRTLKDGDRVEVGQSVVAVGRGDAASS